MSSNFTLNSILTITAGIFVGYAGISALQKNANMDLNFDRSIASAPMTKMGVDQVSHEYIDLKLTTDFIAKNNSDVSVVKITITAQKDLPAGLRYKWQLHKNMTSSDQLIGPLEAMPAGTKKEFSIRVVGFSKEHNSHINFLISGQIAEHKIRRSAIISSRREDSLEYVVEQAALNEKETGKIQKLNNGKAVRKKFDLSNVIK